MSDREQDPLNDPQCAESWQALGQLLAAAQQPLDQAALVAGITARLQRRTRRRRLQFATAGLALAASLAGVVLIAGRGQHGEPLVDQGAAQVAQAPVERELPRAGQPEVPPARVVAPAPLVAQDSHSQREAQDLVASEPAAWDDDLDTQVESLVSQAQAAESRWREQPDSIALFQYRVDEFENELSDGSL